MTGTDSDNVGIAMALVAAAGASTALGASVVFFPSLVKLASRRVLASALGLSAGVMTYVSFVEIFRKSENSFLSAGYADSDAYVFATLCFFGGVVFMLLINAVIKVVTGRGHDHELAPPQKIEVAGEEEEQGLKDDVQCACCSDDPVGDLEKLHRQADEIIATANPNPGSTTGHEDNSEPLEEGSHSADKVAKGNDNGKSDVENDKLIKMGINTAIAIGLHNFPEGLATFVAALADPKVGVVLAIAIGIHNIPEGLCVALPIYYATGNRWKAFGWALLSGASEPFAALLGWAVLASSFSHEMYAVLFGLVAGMMVIISTRELLPTAHRYDPDDTVVTYSFITGMVVMALSLVLFVL